MSQKHRNPLQMMIIYQFLWILYGVPFDIINLRVNKSTISIIINILSDEVAKKKPAYRVRNYCQNKLRKLSRKSEFLYILYSLFDWKKLGLTWWKWYMNMGYNLMLLPPKCPEANRKENLDLPLNLQTAKPMLCRTNTTQLTRLLLNVYHS